MPVLLRQTIFMVMEVIYLMLDLIQMLARTYMRYGAGSASGASTLFNVAIGFNAGKYLLGGDNNVFLGCYAGHYATDCVDNVFLGSFAGRCNDGSYNIFLGINSGKGSATVCCNTAGHNIAIGESAGCGLLTGCSNVFLGMYTEKHYWKF